MDKESIQQIKNVFLESRTGAILRCVKILLDSGKKELAEQALQTTKIDRNQLAALKMQSAKGIH